MHKFLDEKWFAALEQPAELHDPSESELKTCVFNFGITNATSDIDASFHLLSVGQEITVEHGQHPQPNTEARLPYETARELMLEPSVDSFREKLMKGEILARGDLAKGFDLLERLTTDDRGIKLISHLQSITS